MNFIQQFHWRPEFGDPTLMGWLTTTAYALAALTAFFAARRAGRAPGLPSGSRFIWWLVMVLMLFLGSNKQLDLQALLNETGRLLSYQLGLYEQRRELQKWFMISLLAASSLGALSTLIFFRGFWKQHLLLAAGLLLSLTYVALRAATIEHLNSAIIPHLENPGPGGLLETGGIALILLAAFIDWRNPSKAAKPPWKPAAD
jgi:hypothetical protein